MGVPKPQKLKKPVQCNDCGADIWEPMTPLCPPCTTVHYLKFRHAMNWPLTEQDKERLGLK